MASVSDLGQVALRRSARIRFMSGPSPFMYLPKEIWAKILKKLTQKQALSLRTVTKDFKDKVDNLYEDWVIELNEESPYLDMMLSLRVKEVKIKQLLNPAPNRPPGIVFKFPDLLTKLTVEFCKISPGNLHALLLQSKNLKSLSICFDKHLFNDAFWQTLDPATGYNFPELDTFSIHLYFIMDTMQPGLIEGSIYGRIMSRSLMPKLRSFKMNWDGGKASHSIITSLGSSLVIFLSQHGQTLKEFTYLNLLCRGWEHQYTLPLLENAALLRNCSTLENILMISHSDFSPDELTETWKYLVLIQSKLQDLYFGRNLWVLSPFCVELCSKNFETLKKIEINEIGSERWSFNERGEFDASIFGVCVNLQELHLSLSCRVRGTFTLCNLLALPQQIEMICSTSFLISSDDFSACLKKFQFMKNLNYGYESIDKHPGYDISEPMLKQILDHPALTRVELSLFKIDVPNNDNFNEREIEKIFVKLGCKMKMYELQDGLILSRKTTANKAWVLESYST